MWTYIFRRILILIPVMFGVTLFVFLLMKIIPGDPVRALLPQDATAEDVIRIRHAYHLDQPIYVQYVYWLNNALHGDLGRSLWTHREVTEAIFQRLPASFELACASMFIAVLLGLLVGVFSAIKRDSLLDHGIRVSTFILLAMPSFWLGLLLILLFARQLNWLPASGRGDILFSWDWISSLVLPALTLGTGTAAFLARVLRSSMLDVLNMDYVTCARAKGLNSFAVIVKHALRNALIPFVTISGLALGSLLGGSIIVEEIFAYPGVGKLLVEAIQQRDLPIVQGGVLFLALAFVLTNLFVDILYAVLDPRIQLEKSTS